MFFVIAERRCLMEFDLVFEGGGAKGTVFVGAMEVFYGRGHTDGRLMGTSAGAITAVLVAAGYTVQEMSDSLAEKVDGKSVFSDFLAPSPPFPESLIYHGALSHFLQEFNIPWLPDFIENALKRAILKYLSERLPARNLFSFMELGGWYSADNFVKWLSRKMDSGELNGKKRQFSNLSLQQFFEATGKDLTLIAADTTGNMMLALNHSTAPDCPVVWAVRMSMSVPLLWQEVIWQKEWGTYRGMDISGHSIVDGGLLSNFPIELFISDLPIMTALMGPKTHDNILGLLIDDDVDVPGLQLAPKPTSGINIAELRTVQRISGLVNTMLGARDKSVIAAFESLVVRLPAKGYGLTEFDMSDERRALLVDAGRQAMKAYLNKREQQSAISFASPEEQPSPQEVADQVAERMLR
jgi:NTE family protein